MLLLKFFVNIIVSLAQKFNKKGAILRRLEYNYTSSPFKYFDRFFTKNDQLICLDIGASVGHTASHFNNLFPNAKIYAFEPTPDSFKQLQTMHCDNKNINCFQLALSDSEGENDFYVSDSFDNNSLFQPNVELYSSLQHKVNDSLKKSKKIKVQTTTLESWYNKNIPNETIDIIKIDTQGAEYKVLKGAEKFLSEKVKLISFEVQYINFYHNMEPFYEIFKLLYDNGFYINDFYAFSKLNESQLIESDVIFLNQKYFKENYFLK